MLVLLSLFVGEYVAASVKILAVEPAYFMP